MTNLKELLKEELTKEELNKFKKSFDIIGSRDKSIAIIEIPSELYNKKEIIAKSIIKLHKNVSSVLLKKSKRKGIYRKRDYELIIGQKNTEVTHIEFGCKFFLDPTKVYFSPREINERLRISKQIKPKELVMVFFAGIGPYCIVLSKNMPVCTIGIEINPDAFYYMIESVKRNKLEDKVIPIW